MNTIRAFLMSLLLLNAGAGFGMISSTSSTQVIINGRGVRVSNQVIIPSNMTAIQVNSQGNNIFTDGPGQVVFINRGIVSQTNVQTFRPLNIFDFLWQAEKKGIPVKIKKSSEGFTMTLNNNNNPNVYIIFVGVAILAAYAIRWLYDDWYAKHAETKIEQVSTETMEVKHENDTEDTVLLDQSLGS